MKANAGKRQIFDAVDLLTEAAPASDQGEKNAARRCVSQVGVTGI